MFSIPISGPKGSGTISVNARKTGDEWTNERLLVLSDGGRIDLLD